MPREPRDTERTVYVEVARELLEKLGEWSEPVRIKVERRPDDSRLVLITVKEATNHAAH